MRTDAITSLILFFLTRGSWSYKVTSRTWGLRRAGLAHRALRLPGHLTRHKVTMMCRLAITFLACLAWRRRLDDVERVERRVEATPCARS